MSRSWSDQQRKNTIMSDENQKSYEVVSKETPFQGFFRIDRYTFRHTLHDGTMGQPLVREIFERGQAACVLVYDQKADTVLLVSEFRPGAAAAALHLTDMYPTGADIPHVDCWMLGPVAGMIDAGETPEQAATREASEEAGVTVQVEALIGPLSVMPSPGGSSEILHLYLALGDLSKAGGIYGMDGEGENIRAVVLPRREAMTRVVEASGEVVVGTTVNLLLWLDNLIHNGRICQIHTH